MKTKSFLFAVLTTMILALPCVAQNNNDFFWQEGLTDRDLQKAEEVLAQGINVNGQDAYGRTALMMQVKAGNLELVKLLLDHGANVNAKDKAGNTALHIAKEAKKANPTATHQAILDLIRRAKRNSAKEQITRAWVEISEDPTLWK